MVFPPRYGADEEQPGSAITYVRRYSLAAALTLATEEDDDGDAATAAKNALKTTLLDSITLETRANGITKLKERLREFSKDPVCGRSQ